jgi:hypothetical protein
LWDPDVTVTASWQDGSTGSYLVTPASGGRTVTYTITATKPGYAASLSFDTTIPYLGDLVPVKPVVTGSTALGGVLVASAGDWGSSEVVTTINWYRDPSSAPIHTGTSYTVTEDDLDRPLTVKVTGSRAGYSCFACGTDAGTSTVTIPAAPFTATQVPVISFDDATVYNVGDALTVSSEDWVPAASVSYEWFRDDELIGSGATHTLVAADFGRTLTVAATGTRTGFITDHATSAPLVMPYRTFTGFTIAVRGGTAIGNVLSISGVEPSQNATYAWHRGTVLVGTASTYTITAADATSTLRATYSEPAHNGYDAYSTSASSATIDALVLTPGTAAYTLVGNTLLGTTSGWATDVATTFAWEDALGLHSGSSYTLTAANYDTTLTLHVTGSLALHADASATTTYAVPKGTLTQDAASITGTLTPGSTLTGHAGTASVTGTTATGEWLVNGLAAGTGFTYLVKPADRGATITFTSTVSLARYTSASATASTVIPLGTIAPGNVTVTGGNSVGSVLTASTGTWPVGVTLATRWLRNGVVVAGASGTSYTLAAVDQGALVSFEVAASGQYLAGTTVTVSAAIPAAIVPPVVVEKIVDHYLDRVVEVPVEVRVEVPVDRVVERIVERPVTVTVEKVVTVTETLLEFTAVPDPTISGKAVVGSTLTASSKPWTPGAVTLTYQWYAGSEKITGATGKKLKLAASVVGKKISVKVTGTRAGYSKESVRSDKTDKVKAKKK